MPTSLRRDLIQPRASPRRRGPRYRLSPLARDVAFILVVKFVLLAGLWWAFFSHPVARHMSIEPQRVGERLFPPPAAAVAPEPPRADR